MDFRNPITTVPPAPILISLEEAAALERVSYQALKKSLRRKHVMLSPDPHDKRRKLLPVSALTPGAYADWLKRGISAASKPLAIAPARTETGVQPAHPFSLPSPTERELAAAIPMAIPQRLRPYAERWALVVGETRNGSWHKHRGEIIEGIAIRNGRDYIRAVAKVHDIGVSTLYGKLKLLRELERDPATRDNVSAEFWRRTMPQPRPGRSGYSFFANQENSWMLFKLQSLYLNEAKLSTPRAHELLCAEIDAKQRSWGLRHLYEKPTLKQCRTALAKIDDPTKILAREGDKAYNDRCSPYISRNAPDFANDCWVTDQRICNVRLRDDGERLGRVTVVNFLDVTSWKWLGCWFGRDVNSDLVMEAVAQALQHGVPKAVHTDLGKEFIAKRFMDEIEGLWRRLGVEPIPAIGRNPQSKTIERWHREVDRFDQELPGWCGSNPDERPEKLQREEAAHHEWLKTGYGGSPLLTISEYIGRYVAFCAERWNAQHRGHGRYLRGMTPNEAWNARQPEGGTRRLSPAEIDFYTADHRFLTVARGGQVNLTVCGTKFEYVADQLFLLQGKEVEVIVPRRKVDAVVVIYPVPGGTAQCIAKAKRLLDWLPEDRAELREELRRRYAIRKAIRRGLDALATFDEGPVSAPSTTVTVEAPKALPGPARSGSDLRRLAHRNLSSDIANELLQTEAHV